MTKQTDLVDGFTQLWYSESPPDLDAYLASAGSVDAVQLSRLARIDQSERWLRGDRRSAETYLNLYPALESDSESAVDLIYHEFLILENLNEEPSLEDFQKRFPVHATAISDQVSFHRVLAEATGATNSRVPRAKSSLLPKLPAQFGRYRVVELLGRGGMGTVYLAEDPELGRQVALKLPRFDRDDSPETLERFRREARIASTFHHPNLCPVYDFGELEGALFLTMPYMTGQSLSARLLSGPITESEAVRIVIKIARAMSVAHRSGVVHRDLKPSNILLREDGEPVVMDFGLARRGLDLDPKLTGSGALMGTLAYMAPEQIRSTDHDLDPAGDVYSLGVILYELLAGRPPFQGNWQDVLEQIQFQSPPVPSEHVASQHVAAVTAQLDQICLQSLDKDPLHRFDSMDALAYALEDALAHPDATAKNRAGAKSRSTAVFRQGQKFNAASVPSKLLNRAIAILPDRRWPALLVGAVISTLVILGWLAFQQVGVDWAQKQIPVIEELAKAKKYDEAFGLAVHTRKYLPNDAKLNRMMSELSDYLSVSTVPAGARVYLKRFNAGSTEASADRVLVGTTPIVDYQFARGACVVSVEKNGFVPFQRTISGPTVDGLEALFPPLRLDVKLTPVADTPKDMVFVPGGDYRLVAWRRPTADKVKLNDYFIDKFEVTNLAFQEFVKASGYLERRFWTQPFVKEGRSLTHDEAMRELTDSTGLPGPRGWSNGNFPEGHADRPVTGITWYEAAAYASFRGKSLPTIFQWEKAARDGAKSPLGLTMPWGLLQGSTDGRANFASNGTVAVGSLEFGMSPFGCYEMAGNVAEWCLNDTTSGFIVSGSSWAANCYEFGYYGMYPGFDQSDCRGFRCVRNTPGSTSDEGARYINMTNEVPKYTPKPASQVKAWFADYDYDKKSPLKAHVLHVKETEQWRREKIEYSGADGERVLAYLYLPPKQFPGPHQVIQFVPGGDVFYRFRTVPESIEADSGRLLQSGRAVFTVVANGFLERDRPPGWVTPDPDSAELFDDATRYVIELRRGLDYLETRDDLDSKRIAFLQASGPGVIVALPAVETRYGAVVHWGAGIYPRWEAQGNPKLSLVNFAPLIPGPKLLVHGRHDELVPLKTAAEPLFGLLSEPKRMVEFDGGHRPESGFLSSTVNSFLDETLGPVALDFKVSPQTAN